MHTSEAEVLDRPGRAPVRRRTRWLGTAAVVLVVAGWAGDAALRSSERDALATCAEQAVAATGSSDRAMGMIRAYVQPALLAVPAGSGQDTFFELVAAEAREVGPGVEAALATCRATDVVAFHPALRERRDALVAWLAARADHLDDIGADGRAYYRDRPGLARLRAAALDGRP